MFLVRVKDRTKKIGPKYFEFCACFSDWLIVFALATMLDNADCVQFNDPLDLVSSRPMGTTALPSGIDDKASLSEP